MKIEALRKKYPTFVYKNFSIKKKGDDLSIFFDFKILPNISFRPNITIPNGVNFQSSKIDNLVFNLGLVEMISYWKATCSPVIKIKAGQLNKKQIKWWKDLLLKGLGEFFYQNRIDFTKKDFLRIKSKGENFKKNKKVLNNKRVLIPIGGGKDSIVTLESMRKSSRDLICFSLNPNQNIKKVISKSSLKAIFIKREIDSKLLELNQRGFLNGHTPFSAYLSFLTALVCTIFDIKYVAFSNEKSANIGNANYLGKEINHQYSKSFQFEKKFRKYSKKYLNKDFKYFSFLRPLNELQIGKKFSSFEEYFDSFISCNETFKDNSLEKGEWCGKCSKCLFVYLMIFPFLKEEKIEKIFAKNLFKDKDLLPLLKTMILEDKVKPFECVGTKEEIKAALSLATSKYKEKREKLPPLLAYFEKKFPTSSVGDILDNWNQNNFVPDEFKNLL